MLFTSFEYVFFFAAVLLVCWMIGFGRWRTWFLIAASFYFYASNNGWQILLLIGTASLDYMICLRMDREEREPYRKAMVALSVASNIGVLCYFKYFHFIGGSIETTLHLAGLSFSWPDLRIALPVGISFYTFEALSYTIDVYRRHIRAEREASRLFFLVSFFPHLIAGPIVRAADFFPQLDRKRPLSVQEFESGLLLIVIGVIKKLVLADSLAPLADAAFDTPDAVGIFGAWLGVYAFAFQIYFDFSGYTDIARGSARLLGYELPENFRAPYGALSITDFWRRWHISLSTWLRDYLYISLGGNRMRSRWGVYRNLMITMILGGLWHGAAWHFVIWGFLHGLLLSLERLITGRKGTATSQADRVGSDMSRRAMLWRQFITFQLVSAMWIPFRANDIGHAGKLLAAMAGFSAPAPLMIGQLVAVVVIGGAWLCQSKPDMTNMANRFLVMPLAAKATVYGLVALVVTVAASDIPKAFIYFQF